MKIALTLGDPAGIGPEVALKALRKVRAGSGTKFVLLGPSFLYENLSRKLFGGRKSSRVEFFFPFACPKRLPAPGRPDRAWTVAAVQSIRLAVQLALKKEIDAVVTPPINKTGLRQAGFDWPGHTELLAALSRTKKFGMMLVGGRLRVSLVTRHLPIRKVPDAIRTRGVIDAILLTDRELRRSFGIRCPRLVVCGLNPHAGENGHLGDEEIRVIAPAVRAARRRTDARIVGPLSPDALFVDAYAGRYDAEICMYHDQGLIPLKMISRGAGVNVTLGLPFVRTSPDHGTAYDIAPRRCADEGSMVSAIELAVRLARHRKRYDARR